jgi:hypothetical protein
MENPFVWVVQMTLPLEKAQRFREYEDAAARIMARYGGRIEKVMESIHENVLTEIHWVVFETEESFAAYQKDVELASLQPARAQCGVETKVWRGRQRPSYGIS